MKARCPILVIRILMGILCIATSPLAIAQADYPNKPIHLVVPMPSGSALDLAARSVTQQMTAILGQPIVVENRPGASGVIGADRVAKAKPDGYTLGGLYDSMLTMAPHLHPHMPWDALTDFKPVSLVASIEWGLVVSPRSSYRRVSDLIEAARSTPGDIAFGSGGMGSPQHMAMAAFMTAAGIDMLHIPYRSALPAAKAIGANVVQAGFQNLGAVADLIQTGKLHLLSVSASDRLAQFPDVPTIQESGLPGFTFDSSFLIVAPAGTSPVVADRISEAVRLALAHAEVRAQLANLGMTPLGTTPSDSAKITRTNVAAYSKLIYENVSEARHVAPAAR